jgi:hypothetical protein
MVVLVTPATGDGVILTVESLVRGDAAGRHSADAALHRWFNRSRPYCCQPSGNECPRPQIANGDDLAAALVSGTPAAKGNGSQQKVSAGVA